MDREGHAREYACTCVHNHTHLHALLGEYVAVGRSAAGDESIMLLSLHLGLQAGARTHWGSWCLFHRGFRLGLRAGWGTGQAGGIYMG